MARSSNWNEGLREARKKIKSQPFRVLIWGPQLSPKTPQVQKRIKIRRDLESVVGKENVKFSEDFSNSQDKDPIIKEMQRAGDYAAEQLQIHASDVVIIIAESTGSLAETALYQEEMLGKSIIFTTKRTAPAFAKTLYVIQNVEYVSPKEWESCNKVRQKAREYVEHMRSFKLGKNPLSPR
jgi:hypothetical protein